jgi:hypothetical protein
VILSTKRSYVMEILGGYRTCFAKDECNVGAIYLI